MVASLVIPDHRRLKDGVLSQIYVPGIRVNFYRTPINRSCPCSGPVFDWTQDNSRRRLWLWIPAYAGMRGLEGFAKTRFNVTAAAQSRESTPSGFARS
jgi:hypothetical protein